MGVGMILLSTFIAAISQVMLKLSARKDYSVRWREYINPLVISAYSLFVVTTILSVFAHRYIPMTLCAALAVSGQIFVPCMSYLFLKEKISRRRLMGMSIIVVGILIFSIQIE